MLFRVVRLILRNWSEVDFSEAFYMHYLCIVKHSLRSLSNEISDAEDNACLNFPYVSRNYRDIFFVSVGY